MAQSGPPQLFLYFSSNPPGLRCPVFAARDGARLQKADRVPLALSQFSLRGTVPPCENWSAAPGCRCPNMRRGTRPACIFGRLPLLRFGCFCRRQRLSSAASGGSLYHPLDAVAAAAPAPPRLFLPQAAARLRSPPPADVPLQPAAAPPCWGALNHRLLLLPQRRPADCLPKTLPLCLGDYLNPPTRPQRNPRPCGPAP